MYKLTGLKEKRNKDENQVNYMIEDSQQVLTWDNQIKASWIGYFNQLFNSNHEVTLQISVHVCTVKNRLIEVTDP